MRATRAIVTVVVLFLLAACTLAPRSAADRVIDGVPDELQIGEQPGQSLGPLHPDAGWMSEDEFGVVLLGSSSCPPVITRMKVAAPDEITLSVNSSRRGNCTDDASPRTHIFQVPDGVTERPIKLHLDPRGVGEYLLLP